MRRSSSDQIPAKPSSRSGPPVYLSLVSTKENFQDSLLINKTTGVPLYATITQADIATLYAIDSNMELQKVATLSWGQGGKSSRTTLTNATDQTVPLKDVSVTSQGAFESFMAKKADRTYSYGRFMCKWSEEYRPWAAMGLSLACYRGSPLLPADSFSSPVSLQASPSTPTKGLLATLMVCSFPGKPSIKIDVHAGHLLQQVLGEDGLTNLDHVVLGALLACVCGGRKQGKEPKGWLNEAQLQEQLRSRCLTQTCQSSETLPLYQSDSSTDGCPPLYASRISIVSRQSAN